MKKKSISIISINIINAFKKKKYLYIIYYNCDKKRYYLNFHH